MKKKKLSVLMPFIDNPYLAYYTHELYKKYWIDEVCEVVIALNCMNTVVENYIKSIWINYDKQNKVRIISKDIHDYYWSPGLALNKAYEISNTYSDNSKFKSCILVLDDDSFIYKKGFIDRHLKMLDKYDAIGIGSEAASPDFRERARLELDAKWGKGRIPHISMIPRYAFYKKEILERTRDVDFDYKNWDSGGKSYTCDIAIWVNHKVLMLTDKVKFLEFEEHEHLEDPDQKKAGRYHVRNLSQMPIKCLREDLGEGTEVNKTALAWFYYLVNIFPDSDKLGLFDDLVRERLPIFMEKYGLEPQEAIKEIKPILNKHKGLCLNG